MSRLIVFAAVLICWLPGAAQAVCTVQSMDGQTLEVDEPTAGAWNEAATACHEVFKKAKIYGVLFEGVFGGSFKVQEIRKEVEGADKEYEELKAVALDHVMRFQGSCAGEILEDVLRKADGFREPERNLVDGVLQGKPVQASTRQVHDGREEHYLKFERQFLRLWEEAVVGDPVGGAGSAPDEPPPADEAPADTE